MLSLTLLAALISGAAFLYILLATPKQPRPAGTISAPSPPGSLPFVGHAPILGPHPHRTIQKLSQQYGEIFRLRLGWHDWYMLCSPSAVHEILDKQSAVTSSRAPAPVANDALSGGLRFLFMEYGDRWRRCRAVSHRLLTPKVSATFKTSQEWEGRALCEEVLRETERDEDDEEEDGVGMGRGSEAAYKAVRRYTVSVIMTSTYGRRIPEWECEEVREIYGIMSDFSTTATPGTYLADTIVPLGKLPIGLQWWRKSLQPLFDRQANLWMKLWNDLKARMQQGTAPECFVKQVIEQSYQNAGITELQAAFLAGSLIEAGSETTSAAINTALLYLLAKPSVQQKAYAEIKRVVGTQRSPTFADEENLPYIRAIVKETMRIRPVTNIGTPHYTTAPVVYKNIYIPANSVVAIQQYAIHYDPHLFPDPESFIPERYLDGRDDSSGSGTAGYEREKEREHFNFGAGRRICSGMHLAENSMFIVLAKVLWGFEILPPLDEKGNEVRVDTGDEAFMRGGNTVPKPFKARWRVRGEEVRSVIVREWDEARRDGYVLRGEKVGVEGVEV